MSPLSVISLAVLVVVSVYSAFSDLKTERIPNNVLLVAAIVAAGIDVLHYGFLRSDLAVSFALNAGLTAIVAIVLFYTGTWAGGDCKLACVLALLYPAPLYAPLAGAGVSLPISLGLSFALGALYLLVCLCLALLRGRERISLANVGKQLLVTVPSYCCALSCVCAIMLLNAVFVSPYLQLSPIVIAAICFCCIWLLSSRGLLGNRLFLIVIVTADIVGCVLVGAFPLGANPLRYLLVLAVVLIRPLVVRQQYVTVPTEEVQEGAILSTATTLLFAGSRVKGLPSLSTEGLDSRLSAAEAESVRRWGKSTKGRSEVQVVRKMPFGVFISMGYVLFFCLWGVLA